MAEEIKRSDDEIAALHLHRYQGWVETLTRMQSELVQLHQHMQLKTEHATNALLEAREEQAALIALGLTQQEIEAVAKIPVLPTDPLAILRRARSTKKG